MGHQTVSQEDGITNRRNSNKGEKEKGKKHPKKFFNWLLMAEIHKNTDKHVEHLSFYLVCGVMSTAL